MAAALWDFGVPRRGKAGGDSGEEEGDDDGDEEAEDGDAGEFTLDEVLRLGGTKVREREHVAAGIPIPGRALGCGVPRGCREQALCSGGGGALARVAHRTCGCPIPGDAQGRAA